MAYKTISWYASQLGKIAFFLEIATSEETFPKNINVAQMWWNHGRNRKSKNIDYCIIVSKNICREYMEKNVPVAVCPINQFSTCKRIPIGRAALQWFGEIMTIGNIGKRATTPRVIAKNFVIKNEHDAPRSIFTFKFTAFLFIDDLWARFIITYAYAVRGNVTEN